MSAEKPRLLARVRGHMRARHLSPRTEQAYLGWIIRYVRYHGLRHPSELGEREIIAYLTHLAAEQHVSRSTQMQALSALMLMYREVLGIAIGLLIATSSFWKSWLQPWISGLYATPTIALGPLFILWLGIGESFKIAIISLGVFIPIYINTHAALSSIDNRYVELAESVRLNRWQFVRQIVIPGALPGFFVGLRLAVVGSWLSLVVLEQINATSGLGYMMYRAQNYGQVEVIFVGLLVYASFGFASNEIVRFIERRTLSWQRTLSS